MNDSAGLQLWGPEGLLDTPRPQRRRRRCCRAGGSENAARPVRLFRDASPDGAATLPLRLPFSDALSASSSSHKHNSSPPPPSSSSSSSPSAQLRVPLAPRRAAPRRGRSGRHVLPLTEARKRGPRDTAAGWNQESLVRALALSLSSKKMCARTEEEL